MRTITFNTGRLYTAEGQVITVSFDEKTGQVYFADHSRMVYGEFVLEEYILRECWNSYTDWHVADTFVLHYYDVHKYKMSMEAMKLQRTEPVHSYRL